MRNNWPPKGQLAFIKRSGRTTLITAIAYEAHVPETLIHRFIGRHTDTLITGFSACPKPFGCGWMNHAIITSIENHPTRVEIELEPCPCPHTETTSPTGTSA